MSSISVRFNSFLFFYSIFNERKSLSGSPRHCRVVGLDGLEPSTSRLSGVRSSHLSYKPFDLLLLWLAVPPFIPVSRLRRVVEMMGFEPMTPCLQGRCSPS